MARKRERDAAKAAQGAVELRERIAHWLDDVGIDEPEVRDALSDGLSGALFAMQIAAAEVDAMIETVPTDTDGAAQALRHATSIELWMFEELPRHLRRMATFWERELQSRLAERTLPADEPGPVTEKADELGPA